MKKILAFVFTLSVIGLGVLGSALADVDIKKGQRQDASPVKFFVARFARQPVFPTRISADSIVVWDSTSNDGVTVNTSTTSHDGLVVGVAMDNIPGSSRDTSPETDLNYNNWGRVQCWGRYNEMRWAAAMSPTGISLPAGSKFGTSATAQQGGLYFENYIQSDVTTANQALNTSRDHAGNILEATTASDTAIDVFLDRC